MMHLSYAMAVPQLAYIPIVAAEISLMWSVPYPGLEEGSQPSILLHPC